jgi:MFS superfamily sulfate permease-like transporter
MNWQQVCVLPPSSALLTDLRGGLVAAAVVLPQATAFGVTVFAAWLGTAAGAALTGLVGAILLLLISGSRRRHDSV